MVKKIDNGTILILDVGKNMAETDGRDQKSFFEKTIACAARIIERKILSQGNDYLGIILLGSKITKNNMAEQCEGVFRNIQTFTPLQPPTWKMIRDLPESPSKKAGDWVESLAVAVDHAKNEVSGVNIINLKIVLVTNFEKPTGSSSDNVQMVIDGIKSDKIEVDVIGPDIYDENNKSFDYECARKIVEETDGVTATFDYTINCLVFHKKKAIKATACNMDLSIGSYLKIPVTIYIRLSVDKFVEKWKKHVKDPVTSKSSTTEGRVTDRAFYNTKNQTKVDKSDVTKGYEFGGQNVPASESDKFLEYKPGDKSIILYGFTPASKIHWQHLTDKGLRYMFGRKGDKKAQLAITCLTEILHERNLVGIVRKIHVDNKAPKMFVLMPVIDTNNYMCLSMIGLCYKEAIKYMPFPPTNIRKYACTKDQVNAFVDLIKVMDLSKAYDDTYDNTEAFPIGETVDPTAQYLLDCIAYRALNPDKPLPQPKEQIMSLFKIPPDIEERSREAQEKIKKLFMLQKVEVKPKRKVKKLFDTSNLDSNAKADIDDATTSKIDLPKGDDLNNKIGTIDPIKDCMAQIDEGKTISDLASELAEVIESLMYFNLDGLYKKAITTMSYFRNECIKTDPSVYNNWLLKFKVDLVNRNRDDLQSLIKDRGVDFILKSENNLSTFETTDSHEESQLYAMDTVPEATEFAINSEVNDIFDEM